MVAGRTLPDKRSQTAIDPGLVARFTSCEEELAGVPGKKTPILEYGPLRPTTDCYGIKAHILTGPSLPPR